MVLWGVLFVDASVPCLACVQFPLEIVRRTRAAVGKDFVIVFRLSLLDLVEKGLVWDEVLALAVELQGAGISILNSGVGWHEVRFAVELICVFALSLITGTVAHSHHCNECAARGVCVDHCQAQGERQADGASVRNQPHQYARIGRVDTGRRQGRSCVDGAPLLGRCRVHA